MQIAVLLCCFGVTFAATLGAQGSTSGADTRPNRIINKKYRFSVMLPPKWFVYDGGDVPVFFNFRPEDSLQGELPPGGASMCMLVDGDEKEGDSALSRWVEARVRSHHGTNIERKNVKGPVATGGLPALRVAFDSLSLSPDLESLRYVMVVWQAKSRLFGVELSFAKADPNASRYETVMLELMRSFKEL